MTWTRPSRAKLLRVLRFASSSGMLLGFKLGSMWLLQGLLRPQLAYVVVHVLLLFVSYGLHAYWSFGARVSWQSFVRYTRAVALIKLTDYVIFSVVFSLLKIEALISVAAATLVIWMLRYGMVSRAFGERTATEAEHDEASK